ncbi:hypothetical protein [Rhizobium sp. L51/94]|uniref:hypothetical protein n=1 Tax=Rhizobium sp. L51/94 TaxID=2819999 RepID=UPI001C5BA989|nr:hypothetical protein [Rhizobium sp. L51/94]QXZ79684.1 hypothetical protein J5274_06795 [Rhizobium sp. L51/94]
MANGNSFDPMASWARLSERVENQGKDIVDLRSNMNTGFQTIQSSIGTLSNELRNNSKTQWPVIWSAAGVCMAALLAAGSFFYGTLNKGQDKLDTQITLGNQNLTDAISKLASATTVQINDVRDKMVTQQELKWRTDRGIEDRKRTDDTLADLRIAQVPRAELERVWHTDDLVNAQLQKQIDELKASAAGTYGARDVILDLRERLDRIERERAKPSS